MPPVQPLADPNYVHDQYRDASNLNARIRLHQEFSTNKESFQRWLFERFQFPSRARILELGCGPGNLWAENLERIPPGLEVTLSDLSEGMLAQARENLKGSPAPFRFKIIDAQSIPFEAFTFDTVIANHMLYHVPDLDKALSEIARVLKLTGRLFASTGGSDHLKELKELVCRFDPALYAWGRLPTDSFNLEQGAAQLARYFAEASLARFPNSLIVTDARLLTDYILSGRMLLSPEQQDDLAKFVARELEAGGGKIHVTIEAGVFTASGPLRR
jgi:SAM-dependent methyltransferase